jgi:hypothetical protein
MNIDEFRTHTSDLIIVKREIIDTRTVLENRSTFFRKIFPKKLFCEYYIKIINDKKFIYVKYLKKHGEKYFESKEHAEKWYGKKIPKFKYEGEEWLSNTPLMSKIIYSSEDSFYTVENFVTVSGVKKLMVEQTHYLTINKSDGVIFHISVTIL